MTDVHMISEEDLASNWAASLKEGSAGEIHIILDTKELPEGAMEKVLPLLAAGGKVVIDQASTVDSNGAEMACLFAGFVEGTTTTSGSRKRTVAKKPEWEAGAAVSLPNAANAAGGESKADVAPKAWVLTDDDDDIMDEDALLDSKDLAKPVKPAESDCATTRKACKNCSCGRAEMEAAEEASAAPKAPVDPATFKSACGNCALGDAFRCAGCPSRGLPPFKPGETVTISTD